MNIMDLKAVLKRIEGLYAAAGASTAAKDLRSVAHLLDGHDGKSVEAFMTETQELLNAPQAAKTATIDTERVTLHVNRLLTAGIDQSSFDSALCEIDSDTLVRKQERAAIAN
jgi:hypothetical protein